ncbi:MAG: DUF1810 domain-containing protein [Prevotella sp.]|nr:DUF1810 domain-containing protein [Prevotella sp.]
MEELNRFIEAQDSSWAGYAQALKEMKSGGKRSHWIWYIFPQIAGLGFSGMSRHFGIKGKEEALAYLKHPVLGERLREITKTVLSYPENADPNRFMMQPIDALKLKSSMTLFDDVSPNDIFNQVLEKFFNGERDALTIKLLS